MYIVPLLETLVNGLLETEEKFFQNLICKTYFHPYLTRCGTYYFQTLGVEITYS